MSGHRDWAPSSEEHRPITYWGGYPIYATHFIVIVYCVLMVITGIAFLTGSITWLSIWLLETFPALANFR